MFKRITSPAAGARLRGGAIPGLAYLLTILPAIALLVAMLLGSGGPYLLRRDENVALAALKALEQGWPAEDLFLASLSPPFMALLRALGQVSAATTSGRALALLSGVACALLTAAIARRLYGPGWVPPLATALLASSALFVYELTFIRANLLSMAFALAAALALLGADWRRPRQALGLALAAGLLFGLAVQVKALALALGPLLPPLLWRAHPGPWRSRPFLFAGAALAMTMLAGAAASALLLSLALGAGGERVAEILTVHLQASAGFGLLDRLALNAPVVGGVIAAHSLITAAFIAGVLRGLTGAADGRGRALLLLVWAGGVGAVLLVSFPSWDHHYVYLLPPLAIGAAALAGEAARALGAADDERTTLALALLGLALATAGAAGAATRIQAEQPGRQEGEVAQMVVSRTAPGALVWSDNLLFPLLTGRPTDPALADLSIKRILAGELREEELFALIAARPPAAVIFYDGLFDAFPTFTACLEAEAEQSLISLNGQRVFWLREGDGGRVVACGAGLE